MLLCINCLCSKGWYKRTFKNIITTYLIIILSGVVLSETRTLLHTHDYKYKQTRKKTKRRYIQKLCAQKDQKITRQTDAAEKNIIVINNLEKLLIIKITIQHNTYSVYTAVYQHKKEYHSGNKYKSQISTMIIISRKCFY